jgi:hypothetical protein
MMNALRAGAVVLATAAFLTLPAAANEGGTQGATVNIYRIKHALHLRPEQEAYWPAVESALRAVAHARHGGIVSVVLDNASIQRVASAARPLIAVLDFQQLQAASGLCDQMGLGPVVAALR